MIRVNGSLFKNSKDEIVEFSDDEKKTKTLPATLVASPNQPEQPTQSKQRESSKQSSAQVPLKLTDPTPNNHKVFRIQIEEAPEQDENHSSLQPQPTQKPFAQLSPFSDGRDRPEKSNEERRTGYGKLDSLGTGLLDKRQMSINQDKREPVASFYLTLRSKFNRYERAMEILRTSKQIPQEMRYFVASCSKSIFFTFFDKVFDNMSDIDFPSLGNKEREENVEKQNDEYMIKKAMMKGTDHDDIKKNEIKYLQSKYGNMVPELSSFLNKNILTCIHMRHRLSMLFHKSLKDPKLKLASFLKTLLIVEYEINRLLLPKGSLFKIVFYNKTDKLHFVIKMDTSSDANTGKYEVVSFQSVYLEKGLKLAKTPTKNYLGFDALNFENQKYQEHASVLKRRLDDLLKVEDELPKLKEDAFKGKDTTAKGREDPLDAKEGKNSGSFGNRLLESNIWTCMLNRVESEHCAFVSQSNSEDEDESEERAEVEGKQELQNNQPLEQIEEEEEEPLKQISDTSDSCSENFRTIDQVCLLTFCHFCEESDSDENQNIVEKLRNIIQNKNKPEAQGSLSSSRSHRFEARKAQQESHQSPRCGVLIPHGRPRRDNIYLQPAVLLDDREADHQRIAARRAARAAARVSRTLSLLSTNYCLSMFDLMARPLMRSCSMRRSASGLVLQPRRIFSARRLPQVVVRVFGERFPLRLMK